MIDNYNFSVGCIVRKENQVLLVRHTYGGAKGKLLVSVVTEIRGICYWKWTM